MPIQVANPVGLHTPCCLHIAMVLICKSLKKRKKESRLCWGLVVVVVIGFHSVSSSQPVHHQFLLKNNGRVESSCDSSSSCAGVLESSEPHPGLV